MIICLNLHLKVSSEWCICSPESSAWPVTNSNCWTWNRSSDLARALQSCWFAMPIVDNNSSRPCTPWSGSCHFAHCTCMLSSCCNLASCQSEKVMFIRWPNRGSRDVELTMSTWSRGWPDCLIVSWECRVTWACRTSGKGFGLAVIRNHGRFGVVRWESWISVTPLGLHSPGRSWGLVILVISEPTGHCADESLTCSLTQNSLHFPVSPPLDTQKRQKKPKLELGKLRWITCKQKETWDEPSQSLNKCWCQVCARNGHRLLPSNENWFFNVRPAGLGTWGV